MLPTALWPSTSDRNEYQGSPLDGKDGQCVRLTLPLSCDDYLRILEASTPLSSPSYLGLYRDIITVFYIADHPFVVYTSYKRCLSVCDCICYVNILVCINLFHQ